MCQVKIGLLAIQGAFVEHRKLLEAAAVFINPRPTVQVVEIRRGDELTEDLDALIVPGGESTTVAKFMQRNGLLEAFHEWFHGKNPSAIVWGICAGLIALSDSVIDMKIGGQTLIRGLAVTTDRNFYGRQRESFECPVRLTESALQELGSEDATYPGIFIRAPKILSIDKPEAVSHLASVNGDPVAVLQDRILACSFHPELTQDPRFHLLLLKLVLKRRRND